MRPSRGRLTLCKVHPRCNGLTLAAAVRQFSELYSSPSFGRFYVLCKFRVILHTFSIALLGLIFDVPSPVTLPSSNLFETFAPIPNQWMKNLNRSQAWRKPSWSSMSRRQTKSDSPKP
ncbi:hypothetical protein PCANC_24701 [Puccinia coronata f. sp. avenae]|uniref:Uncharacterized protein n=1 Tax=Puccinia coronata f. sp. avenae TaxID=200324 RepID=A0A2N5UIS3_9BASI|nr:hypothetical protein PCANC_24701 [Puccinia coronata f. sp. avenae]PLW37664.1 hypothetical protein PCASD_12170 [Puccinia coronata f. sp. avenae]